MENQSGKTPEIEEEEFDDGERPTSADSMSPKTPGVTNLPHHEASRPITLKKDHIDERVLHQEYAVKSKLIDVPATMETMWGDLLYSCSHCHPSDVIPILGWFPKFLLNNPLNCIMKDIVCGVTITAIVVPQGMAYGMLAALPPVNGLYTAMLPTLGYTVLGTCMHLSIGPFALISMLTAEGVIQMVPRPEDHPEDAVEAARQIAFFSGCMLAILGVLRLGFIGTFLSDPVLSGYCTAVSFIIPTSQLKHAFQAKVERGNFIDTVRQLVERIVDGDINGVSFVIFLVSLAMIYVLQIVNKKKPCEFLKKFPLPAELIVVVITTLVCFVADLEHTQDVKVTGKIPAGLPVMRIPEFGKFAITDLLPSVAMVSLMTYITAMSVSKTFARKFGYEVDSNQELIAFGFSNFLGSISSCYPAAASLSRTAVVGSSGAATPLHNVWMVVMLGVVLSACGPLIETLPNAALAAIVVMAFKSLLLGGYAEMKTTWRVSPPDFLMWSIAFWSTLGTNVTFGIGIAVVSDIFYLFFKTTRPTYGVLGRLKNTQSVYCNMKNFDQVQAVHGVMIFRFDGPLHFANKEVFLAQLMRELRLHDAELNNYTIGRESSRKQMHFWSHMHDLYGAFVKGFARQASELEKKASRVQTIVLDCSPMTHMDMTAARALDKLRQELENRQTKLCLAHCKFVCYTKLQKMGLFKSRDDGDFDVVCFRDLHAAVLWAEGKLEPNNGEKPAEENLVMETAPPSPTGGGKRINFQKTLSTLLHMSPQNSKENKSKLRRSNSNWEELETKGFMGACEEGTIQTIPEEFAMEQSGSARKGHIFFGSNKDAGTETDDAELLAEHLPANFSTTWRRKLDMDTDPFRLSL